MSSSTSGPRPSRSALARAHPVDVVPELDRWISDDDRWLVRAALLHQLRWKDATDRERLARH